MAMTDSTPTARDPDPPAPRPVDARRAVVDAARYNGVTCQRGAYRARRTIFEPDPAARPGDVYHVIRLECRPDADSSWTWVTYVRVVPVGDLRDDWQHPTPIEPGEVALPEEEFDVEDLFVDGPSAVAVPGMAADAEALDDE